MLDLMVILLTLVLPAFSMTVGMWYMTRQRTLQVKRWFYVCTLLLMVAAFPATLSLVVNFLFCQWGLSFHPDMISLWFMGGYAVVLLWWLWYHVGVKTGGFCVLSPQYYGKLLTLVCMIVFFAELANLWAFYRLAFLYEDEVNTQVVCESVSPDNQQRVIAMKYFHGHGGMYETDLYAYSGCGVYRHLMGVSACASIYSISWSKDSRRFVFTQGRSKIPAAAYDLSSGMSFFPAGEHDELFDEGEDGLKRARQITKDFLEEAKLP